MSESAQSSQFGRVDDDGTVFVITSEGERQVGQVPDVSKSEALAFFERRFTSLETEVDLLARRVESGAINPEEARKSVASVRESVATANAVGDLDGLLARLDALTPQIEQAREARRQQRVEQNEQTKQAKEEMIAQAEKLAESNDWRSGNSRFRALLDEWKKLPRIDRATDDELWHRFSSARSAYGRRRKAEYAAQSERREQSRAIKKQIIERSQEIANSTDWQATSAEFRSLMNQWRKAGSAGRDVDDQLWAEFRGLQDTFFNARNAAFNQEEAEYIENKTAKEKLLDEAEATILPINDINHARTQYREFLDAYNQYGRVPRDSIRTLEGRVRALEQAIKAAEDAEWRRTDPEARKRASDAVAMFNAKIAQLEAMLRKAEQTGDTKTAAQVNESLATYHELLDQAQTNLAEFSA